MAYHPIFSAMFPSSYPAEGVWLGLHRRAAALKRGRLYDEDELAGIMAIWGAVAIAAPVHRPFDFSLPVARATAAAPAATVEIMPDGLTFDPETAPPAVMRAAMLHAKKFWGGEGSLALDGSMSHEARLRMRAYAEVYGVKLDDENESFLALSLTKEELARLPEMRRAIRAVHPDAPPARPDEAQQLAAMYRARYPNRAPAPAA